MGKINIFGERLRGCRERMGLTQTDMGNRCGLEPSAISFFETGTRTPTLWNLKRLADACRVTIDFLVGRDEDDSASGKLAEKLLSRFGAMRAEDQDLLLEIAALLVGWQKK